MGRIISVKQVKKTFGQNPGKIVLVGGCFDILHPGHIIFLEKAKKKGNMLVVLLESDKKVTKLKGDGRPIHTQEERAKVLQALRFVDIVIMLPFLEHQKEYDSVVQEIKPSIIAATRGYSNIKYYKRTAKLTGAKLRHITKVIGYHSSTRILKLGAGLLKKSIV